MVGKIARKLMFCAGWSFPWWVSNNFICNLHFMVGCTYLQNVRWSCLLSSSPFQNKKSLPCFPLPPPPPPPHPPNPVTAPKWVTIMHGLNHQCDSGGLCSIPEWLRLQVVPEIWCLTWGTGKTVGIFIFYHGKGFAWHLLFQKKSMRLM